MIKQWNLEEFTNLYQARHLLSRRNKETLGLLTPVDVYVQDPHVADSDYALALKPIPVECEPDLVAGPVSARIAVVDYDADTKRLEEPVRWDHKNRTFTIERDGEQEPITRAHRDLPQFHQVNVWAIVQSVLRMYEATWVLGRPAPWAFEGNRLTIAPNAGCQRNAYYSRDDKALLFYYFDSGGRRVYTCLSHDIIAHETGHAILDGLRPLYLENSSVQTAAFHEFVADLTAIMISLLNNELRWEVARGCEGTSPKTSLCPRSPRSLVTTSTVGALPAQCNKRQDDRRRPPFTDPSPVVGSVDRRDVGHPERDVRQSPDDARKGHRQASVRQRRAVVDRQPLSPRRLAAPRLFAARRRAIRRLCARRAARRRIG